MINIKPKTYHEIVRLCGCLKLRNQLTGFTDENVEELYNFLSQHPSHRIVVTRDTLSMTDHTGAEVAAYGVTPNSSTAYDRILLTSTAFHMINSATSTDSGCSSCGGCGGNNNNNNNNNA